MDWNNGSTDSRIAVALIRLPAKVDVSDPRYGGSILINPGIFDSAMIHMILIP